VRQVTEEPISAGRRLGRALGLFTEVSREEAPEEMIFCSRDAARSAFRSVDKQSGT
jgi:hypothetical protein